MALPFGFLMNCVIAEMSESKFEANKTEDSSVSLLSQTNPKIMKFLQWFASTVETHFSTLNEELNEFPMRSTPNHKALCSFQLCREANEYFCSFIQGMISSLKGFILKVLWGGCWSATYVFAVV